MGSLFLLVFLMAIVGVGYVVWRTIQRKNRAQTQMTQPGMSSAQSGDEAVWVQDPNAALPPVAQHDASGQAVFEVAYESTSEALNTPVYEATAQTADGDEYDEYYDDEYETVEDGAYEQEYEEEYQPTDVTNYEQADEQPYAPVYDEQGTPIYQQPAAQDAVYEQAQQPAQSELESVHEQVPQPAYAYQQPGQPEPVSQPPPPRRPAMVDPATYQQQLSWEMPPGANGTPPTKSRWSPLKIAGAAGAAMALIAVVLFGFSLTRSNAEETAKADGAVSAVVETAVDSDSLAVIVPKQVSVAAQPTDVSVDSADAAAEQAAPEAVAKTESVQQTDKPQITSSDVGTVVGDVLWSVIAVEDLGQRIEGDDMFVEPWTTAGKFVHVEVLVENVGSEALIYGGFSLVDERDRSFDSPFEAFFHVPDEFQCSALSNVNPNIPMRCVEIFEVAADSVQLYAQFGDLDLFSDKNEKVALHYGRTEVAPTIKPAQVTAPVAQPAIQATANSAANLRGGPGTHFDIVGGAVAESVLTIAATNAAGDWYQLQGGEWIAAFLVDGASGELPVASE